MANTIEEQIRAFGVAKVIAVVKEGLSAGGRAGMATAVVGRSTTESVAADLARYFVLGPNSQQGALAAVAAVVSTGRARAARPREVPRVRVYPALGLLLGTVEPDGLEQLRVTPASRRCTARRR